MGALLAARTLVFVLKALKVSLPYKCYTDSTVVLSWIRNNSRKWKAFVANRVSEIHELVDPACWDHCPSESNPADLLTRGASVEKWLAAKFWFEGPEWLQVSEPNLSPVNLISVNQSGEEANSCPPYTLRNQENISFENPFNIERWGTFSKAVRIVAYVLSGKTVSLNSKIGKLTPFLGEDGLIRVKGRLQMSNLPYRERHPIILPKCHLIFLLVHFMHILLKHAGVEN
ncbi:hypothetical protein HOLleu_29000 [Holothuria leucospilota]|uniref:Uncharacterized protein n=1 Tax=Holothuria leucospilota TaxID=206669 RepID=A0A9Q1BNA1_HOLLE|nr:hypothetical protein HOLleu_29000 [Holothuria leucospilota]